MAQNIYDDPGFFAGYSQLPRQVRGLLGAPEWAAIRAMLPDVAGKRVVDLGCGFGWMSRWMREQGASDVLGIDLSQNMIARAAAMTQDAAITYEIADLETLELPKSTFDLAYSALTFHYIRDFDRLARMLYRALVPEGHLVFTIEHPVYMAAAHPDLGAGRRRPQDLAGQPLLHRRRTPDGLVCEGRAEISPHHRHHAQRVDRRRLHASPRRGIFPDT
ncbi:SAM-dependent methyltransferase [Bradyrhizobium elkanii]